MKLYSTVYTHSLWLWFSLEDLEEFDERYMDVC